MLHINFQGSTQIGFQDTVATYFSQKRGITLATFNALPLKVNQHLHMVRILYTKYQLHILNGS